MFFIKRMFCISAGSFSLTFPILLSYFIHYLGKQSLDPNKALMLLGVFCRDHRKRW